MRNTITPLLLLLLPLLLVAPAPATAPIIGTLPTVLIGDAGDISGEGTAALHLLRIQNNINLANKILSNDEGGAAKLRVMYESNEGSLKIGNPAVIGAMTPAEVSALRTTGALPDPAKQIAAPDLMLSLIYDLRNNVTNIAAAAPADNGSTTATITAANILGYANKKNHHPVCGRRR